MSLTVTPTASAKLKEILAKQGSPTRLLRVQVTGGGCSGLQYKLDFTDNPHEGDQVIEHDGVRVCVDPKSALYLVGSQIDYSEELMGGASR